MGIERVQSALSDNAIAGSGDLTIVGHSLGGGIAMLASLDSNVPAITFSAAAVHDNTVKAAEITINPSNIDIVNYRVDGEFLSGLNKITPNARTYGTTISLKGGTGNSLNRHSINEHIRVLSSGK